MGRMAGPSLRVRFLLSGRFSDEVSVTGVSQELLHVVATGTLGVYASRGGEDPVAHGQAD